MLIENKTVVYTSAVPLQILKQVIYAMVAFNQSFPFKLQIKFRLSMQVDVNIDGYYIYDVTVHFLACVRVLSIYSNILYRQGLFFNPFRFIVTLQDKNWVLSLKENIECIFTRYETNAKHSGETHISSCFLTSYNVKLNVYCY